MCWLKESLRRSAYPHQPYVDTLYVLPPRRRRPKLVLTGTSIPVLLKRQPWSRDVRHFEIYIDLAGRSSSILGSD